MQDIQDIYCTWSCNILLEKCVHMLCYLNDLILQLLQVPLIFYGASFTPWLLYPQG